MHEAPSKSVDPSLSSWMDHPCMNVRIDHSNGKCKYRKARESRHYTILLDGVLVCQALWSQLPWPGDGIGLADSQESYKMFDRGI